MSDVHLTEEMLSRLDRRELAASEIDRLFTHLAGCGPCAAFARRRTAPELGVALIRGDERHLDLQRELAPYADGTIDAAGREIVDSHIEECAMCRRELGDLRTVAKPRARWRVPAIAASLAAAAITLLLPRGDERAPSVHPPPPPPSARVTTAPQPARGYGNAEWTRAVEDALRRGRLPFPAGLAELRSRAGTLRGAQDGTGGVLEPAGVVIDTSRPRFRWPPAKGATYTVFVFAGDEEIAQSESLSVAAWERELPRGRTYQWQVEVRKGDAASVIPAAPVSPPQFRIVSTDEHRELDAARRAHPDDALLLAVLHARSGLVAEALEYAKRDPRAQRLAAQEPAAQEPSPISTNGAQ